MKHYIARVHTKYTWCSQVTKLREVSKGDYLSCKWNLETTRNSRVLRMVIRELLPTLKPRRQSLVGGAALTGEVTFNKKTQPTHSL